MFDKDRYITRGIKEKISPLHYLLLWELIDEMEIPDKDELQVFVLRRKALSNSLQEIEHLQEQPPYKKVYKYFTANPVDAKIYVIDDGDRATMLLAEEY